MYHIKEAAELSGVSVKTLHHYDKIGLLVPLKVGKWLSDIQSRGFRTPSGHSLLQVSRVFFRKIAELLKEERSDLLPHLTRQLDYLTRERQHLDTLISTLQKPFKNKKEKEK